MKPLNIALLVKTSPSTRLRETRNMGYWSYPVPEFTWEHDTPSSGELHLDNYRQYDAVVQEDAGTWRVIRGRNSPPLIYVAIDSTLSEQHYLARYERAKQADMILVDHDDLGRFSRSGKPTYRFTYCVNDMLFAPLAKCIDINFHCGSGESKGMAGGKERNQIRRYLGQLSQEDRYSFVSGGVGLEEYARSMGESRVVVNWIRTPNNRSHRIFDAMASKACLITNPFPLQNCGFISGLHYRVYEDNNSLRDALELVLEENLWSVHADEAYKLVIENHTWETRAKELRYVIKRELKI